MGLKTCKKRNHSYPDNLKCCPECDSSNKKRWRKDHKDEYKVKRRSVHLMGMYGLSQKDYDKILLSQDNKCAICRIDQTLLRRAMCVDHCHKTNRNRGLLCDRCNKAYGLLSENPNTIQNLANYHSQWASAPAMLYKGPLQ